MSLGFGLSGTGQLDVSNTAYTTHTTNSTYSIWVYRTGPGGGSLGRVYQKQNGGAFITQFRWNGINARWEFLRVFTAGTGQWYFTGGTAANTWIHLLLVYNESSLSNVPTLYVDGVAQVTTNVAFGTTLPAITSTGIYVLGNQPTGSRAFDGQLAEYAHWSGTYTQAVISYLSKNTSPFFAPTKAVSYIPMMRDNVDYYNAAPTITSAVVQPHPPIVYPFVPSKISPIRTVSLSQTGTGAGSLQGTVIQTKLVSGSIVGAGSAQTVVGLIHRLASTTLGAAILQGTMLHTISLARTISGGASFSGGVRDTMPLSGSILGAGLLQAPLIRGLSLGGSPLGAGDVQEALLLTHLLQGLASGQGSPQGALRAADFAGLVAGSSSLQGTLLILGSLAGASGGSGLIQDTLIRTLSFSESVGGVGAPQESMQRFLGVSGHPFGDGVFHGVIVNVHSVSGTSDGVSDFSGALIDVGFIGVVFGVGTLQGSLSIVMNPTAHAFGGGDLQGNVALIRSLIGDVFGYGGLQLSELEALAGMGLLSGYLDLVHVPRPVRCHQKYREFRLGHVFGRGDLSFLLRLDGAPSSLYRVTYSLFQVHPGGSQQLVGSPERYPVMATVGEYYATFRSDDVGQPGDWLIRWRYQLSPSTQPLVEDYRFSILDAVLAKDPNDGTPRKTRRGWF